MSNATDRRPSPAPLELVERTGELAYPTETEAARRLVPLDDLVGRQEIADRLGAVVSTVDSWRRRYGDTFPEPVAVVSGTPLWRWTVVSTWARNDRRHPGRPRTKGIE